MSAMTSQNSDLPLAPPSAVRRDHVREFHGDAFLDPYEWLRDKESPEVIAHLQAETAYAEAATAPLAPLREQLFQESRTWYSYYGVAEPDTPAADAQVALLDAVYARLIAGGWQVRNLPEALTDFQVTDAQFARRTGREMFAAEAKMLRNLIAYGLISRPRAVFNLAARSAYRVLPTGLLKRVYAVLFHRGE